MFRNVKELERFVESTPPFPRPRLRLEQYPTDAALVALAVWDASLRGFLKKVLDLGCGTGRFALAAAAMGADFVVCVDVDVDALGVALRASRERGLYNVEFLAADVEQLRLRGRFDVVFQNPPFGIWSGRGTDMAFLQTALRHADVVYTIHKLSTFDYVRSTVKRWGFQLDVLETATLNLKPVYKHHKKKVYKVKVFLALVRKS
ncbi:MAG: methyltransferase domain-containing protein [Pyrobaculum sp.]